MMTERGTESRFGLWVGLAIVAAGLLAYANSFTGEFVWDDNSSVVLHEHVQDPSKFFQLFKEDQHAFGRGKGNFYRPLVAASFMLDFALSRPATEVINPETGLPNITPFLFHLTNLLWHLAAALLLFGLLTRLGAPRPVRAAIPLLWVVHPLHTEAVSYISGRADSMAAAFVFAALLFALWRGGFGRRIAGVVLSALCFAAALLCKESAAIYPALLLLVVAIEPWATDTRPVRSAYWNRVPALVASGVLLGLYAWLRFALEFTAPAASAASTFGHRLVETGQAFALYIRLIFLPTGLHMERVLTDVPAWVAGVGSLLLALCIALFLYGLRRGNYRLSLGFGWFLLTWFPISGLIPLNAPMAEHWMYVPLAGFLWGFGELVCLRLRNPVSRQLAAVLVYAVLLLFVGISVNRNRDWKDDESLYLATLAKNPNSIRVQYNLAVAYEVVRSNPSGAKRHYEKVIEISDRLRAKSGQDITYDQEREAHVSLGKILYEEGNFANAAQHFTQALQASVGRPVDRYTVDSLIGRGKALLAMGDAQNALQDLQQAVKQDPKRGAEVSALVRDKLLLGAG